MSESIDVLNERRASTIISELTKCKVKHFLIAPGSRSTPLTLAASNNPIAETTVHFDERGLAFHALGIAKATKSPVCLICTSGTAVANFYPAIIEASMDQIPLVLLTADRPPELRDCGVNQTIDQVHMFSKYLRYEFDMPCPNEYFNESVVATTVNQAVYRSIKEPGGPVLINAMFREPFFTSKKGNTAKPDYPFPKTKYIVPEKKISDEDLAYLGEELSGVEKGIIIAGQMGSSEEADAIFDIAMRLQWPVFADSLSGLRSLGRDSSLIPFYNHILQTTYSKERMVPDVILHLGGHVVSKSLTKWLEAIDPKKYVHVANFPHRHDPNHQVTDRIEMSPPFFCKEVLPFISGRSPGLWLSIWKEASLNIEEAIDEFFSDENSSLSEPYAVHALTHLVEEESSLFFGNSLSIRYADTFLFPSEKTGLIYGNRGASGIDGNLGTIFGIAKGSENHVVGIVGDLTFLHDVNSLPLMHDPRISATLIVLNNFGGGIFHFLPIKDKSAVFDTYFAAKHHFSASNLAKAFGASFSRPATKKQYLEEVEKSIQEKTSHIIEIETDGKANFALHKELNSILSKKMKRTKKEGALSYFIGARGR